MGQHCKLGPAACVSKGGSITGTTAGSAATTSPAASRCPLVPGWHPLSFWSPHGAEPQDTSCSPPGGELSSVRCSMAPGCRAAASRGGPQMSAVGPCWLASPTAGHQHYSGASVHKQPHYTFWYESCLRFSCSSTMAHEPDVGHP